MREEQLIEMKRFMRLFPSLPFAKYVSQVGAAQSGPTQAGTNSVYLNAGVKILAIFSSTRRPAASCRDIGSSSSPTVKSSGSHGLGIGQKRPRDEQVSVSTVNPERVTPHDSCQSSSNNVISVQSKVEKEDNLIFSPPSTMNRQNKSDAPCRTIYVRVQYDKTFIETLPLELMRVRHPQVLIDYLLGSSMWK